ncbi:hypothetical protein ACTXN6_13795 [Corynebacterium casei]
MPTQNTTEQSGTGMIRISWIAIISAIFTFVGIVLFASNRETLGLISVFCSVLGILTILVLLERTTNEIRKKLGSEGRQAANLNYESIERLNNSVASIQQTAAEIQNSAIKTDEFVRDVLIRTIKNQTQKSTATITELQKQQHNQFLSEISLFRRATPILGSDATNELSIAPPQASRKPKDTDYSSSFQKLQDFITGATSHDAPRGAKPRVIFVSSNGAGLGHLTRLNAVDKALDVESMFYTMSSAYKMLGKKSHEIIYFPSHGDLMMRGSDWNPLMKEHFSAVVRGYKPDLIVFDGTYVYQGVVATSKELKIPLVWMQRGCWKGEVDRKSTQRHSANKFAKAVLVPGDYGCEETVDVGQGLEPHYLPPVTLIEKSELLSRVDARKMLQLPLDKKLFLIQLGAGNINDISNIRSKALEFVSQLGAEWEPVLVRNPLSHNDSDDNAHSIQAYPLSLYYNAFDAGAFAAGYNTVQESIELNLPAVFVPNPQTKTDDQDRRALTIAGKDLGYLATGEAQLQDAIIKLSVDENRGRIRESMLRHRAPSGAQAAAKAINSLLN